MKKWIFVKKTSKFTVSATGGIEVDEGGYRYHIFKSSGTLEVTTGGEVEILLVAGGGSGSRMPSNVNPPTGGGAGGVLLRSNDGLVIGGVTNDVPVAATAGTYTVTVGNGGSVMTVQSAGENGQNSRFLRSGDIDLIAVGGGAGNISGTTTGGSGGGKSTVYGSLAGLGTPGQGFNASKNDNGSGAGATGTNGVGGGPGIAIWGTLGSNVPGSYGGGGGGFPRDGSTGNGGGFGGGGAASSASGVAATSGTANTGGGGGGGLSANNGAGGSGIVIVRYKI